MTATDVVLPIELERPTLPTIPPLKSYSAPEAARAAGISYRQIDYWARIGTVVPSISDTDGSGTYRRYSHEDVLVLRLAAQLRRLGAPVARIDGLVLRAAVRSGCHRLLIAPDGRWAPVPEAHLLLNAFRKLGPAAWLVELEVS